MARTVAQCDRASGTEREVPDRLTTTVRRSGAAAASMSARVTAPSRRTRHAGPVASTTVEGGARARPAVEHQRHAGAERRRRPRPWAASARRGGWRWWWRAARPRRRAPGPGRGRGSAPRSSSAGAEGVGQAGPPGQDQGQRAGPQAGARSGARRAVRRRGRPGPAPGRRRAQHGHRHVGRPALEGEQPAVAPSTPGSAARPYTVSVGSTTTRRPRRRRRGHRATTAAGDAVGPGGTSTTRRHSRSPAGQQDAVAAGEVGPHRHGREAGGQRQGRGPAGPGGAPARPAATRPGQPAPAPRPRCGRCPRGRWGPSTAPRGSQSRTSAGRSAISASDTYGGLATITSTCPARSSGSGAEPVARGQPHPGRRPAQASQVGPGHGQGVVRHVGRPHLEPGPLGGERQGQGARAGARGRRPRRRRGAGTRRGPCRASTSVSGRGISTRRST